LIFSYGRFKYPNYKYPNDSQNLLKQEANGIFEMNDDLARKRVAEAVAQA
jgi:hypothetical protein